MRGRKRHEDSLTSFLDVRRTRSVKEKDSEVPKITQVVKSIPGSSPVSRRVVDSGSSFYRPH